MSNENAIRLRAYMEQVYAILERATRAIESVTANFRDVPLDRITKREYEPLTLETYGDLCSALNDALAKPQPTSYDDCLRMVDVTSLTVLSVQNAYMFLCAHNNLTTKQRLAELAKLDERVGENACSELARIGDMIELLAAEPNF